MTITLYAHGQKYAEFMISGNQLSNCMQNARTVDYLSAGSSENCVFEEIYRVALVLTMYGTGEVRIEHPVRVCTLDTAQGLHETRLEADCWTCASIPAV